MRRLIGSLVVCLAASSVLAPAAVQAGVSEDREKPTPEFTREGDKISSRLIPRAKSTSVVIEFTAAGARLSGVESRDFQEVARPEADSKDFRSGLFAVQLEDVPVGGEARITLRSSFFTSSTQYWVFNPKEKAPWRNAAVENLEQEDRFRELGIQVKDGGVFDADGRSDGRILFVGGPWDSFWGYVLGTLFIRFFGVFIVLTVLMVGMLLSGRIYQRAGRRTPGAGAVPAAPPGPPEVSAGRAGAEREAEPGAAASPAFPVATDLTAARSGVAAAVDGPDDGEVSPETAAAVGVALALASGTATRFSGAAESAAGPETAAAIGAALALERLAGFRPAAAVAPAAVSVSSWAQQGRNRMMEGRLAAFRRRRE